MSASLGCNVAADPTERSGYGRHAGHDRAIHGFWVTPRSWEDWKARYEQRYPRPDSRIPGLEVEVEARDADRTPIEQLTVPAVIEHHESVVRSWMRPDPDGSLGRRCLHAAADGSRAGAAGVASTGSHRGRQVVSSQIKSTFPCSRTLPTATRRWGSPSSNGAMRSRTRSARRRHEGCTSTTTSRLPAVFWGSVLTNIHPGHDDTYVDYKI